MIWLIHSIYLIEFANNVCDFRIQYHLQHQTYLSLFHLNAKQIARVYATGVKSSNICSSCNGQKCEKELKLALMMLSEI